MSGDNDRAEARTLLTNAQATLLGNLMHLYSATLLKLDQCILSIVQLEQGSMAMTAALDYAVSSSSSSSSSSLNPDLVSANPHIMLSLDACIWGEVSRLRRGLLSGGGGANGSSPG